MLAHPLNPRPRSLRRVPVLLAGALSLELTVLAVSPAAADPTVTSTTLTATPQVTVGDAVTVDLGLAGVGDVYAYQVTLTFDPDLLEYASGGESGPDGGFDTLDSGDGTVTLAHSRLGTSPSLSGDIATAVTLTAVGDGDGTVSAAVTLVDADGTTAQTAPAPAAVQVAAVVVEPTPEPTPSAPETPAPVETPTAAPAPGASPDPGATASPAASGGTGAVPAATPGSPLASTGFGAAALVLTATAAVAAGLVLRRRSAGAR